MTNYFCAESNVSDSMLRNRPMFAGEFMKANRAIETLAALRTLISLPIRVAGQSIVGRREQILA